MLGRLPARLPEPADLLRASAELLSPAGLTAKASTFSRPEAIRGWCVQLPQGAAVAEVEALADRLLVCPDVVALGAGTRRPTQEPGGAARNARRYTTGEMLETEVAVLTAAAAGRCAGVGLAAPDDVAAALATRELSDEQQSMVRRIATSGAGVEVIVGKAGAGKTSALAAAAEAWRAGEGRCSARRSPPAPRWPSGSRPGCRR